MTPADVTAATPVAEMNLNDLRVHLQSHGVPPRRFTRVELVGVHARQHKLGLADHTHNRVPRPDDDDG